MLRFALLMADNSPFERFEAAQSAYTNAQLRLREAQAELLKAARSVSANCAKRLEGPVSPEDRRKLTATKDEADDWISKLGR